MSAAAIICTSCGAASARAAARYCDACGCPLTAPNSHAEFKQVTALFADVVGSMDIAAAVGPERLREIMAGLVGCGAAVVKRYGGTMDKFTGDGLMAVFGAPVALEDHAIRACLAGLGMHCETQRLAEEVQRRDGVKLQLRVGLNSGQVVAGEIGSGVPGYTAIGEQVGLAQRMESVARSSDPVTHALLVAGISGFDIASGALRADDGVLREIEETLQAAEGSRGDTALSSAKFFLGIALTSREAAADRDRGLELVVQVRGVWVRERTRLYLVPSAQAVAARERARRGDPDGAIPVMRTAVNDLFETGQLTGGVLAAARLVEALLDRGAHGDAAEAEAAIDRLANLPAAEGWAIRDIWLLWLRALLCRTRGDDVAYHDLVNRYRAMAKSLGFEGHIAMAEAM